MPYTALTPLAGLADAVLLMARLVTGSVMVVYGWPKVRDPHANARNVAEMGFRPGWFWGTLILAVEFLGGLAVLAGRWAWVAAALFAVEMALGALWKVARARRPFADYSYDVLLFALCLVLLAFGPGAYALS